MQCGSVHPDTKGRRKRNGFAHSLPSAAFDRGISQVYVFFTKINREKLPEINYLR